MFEARKEDTEMKILLPTDGSDYSEGAARFLTHLKFTQDDEVSVLHVISLVTFAGDTEPYYPGLFGMKQDIGPKILDSTANILKSLPVGISRDLKEGYPDKSIIEASDTAGVDLIVMGARGIKGIRQLLIGSVTRSVAISSPKPVLVIKPPQFNATARLKVLFATDGSDQANAAGKLLASLPFQKDSEITVVNVVWSVVSDIPDRLSLEMDEKIKEEVARARTVEFEESEKVLGPALRNLKERFPNVHGLTRSGDPSAEILSMAEELKTDIIVVGCRGLKGVKGMLGSVSRNILMHSKCSVLVGKTGP
jgi:nucleotide-binding universal stress UspA family protein